MHNNRILLTTTVVLFLLLLCRPSVCGWGIKNVLSGVETFVNTAVKDVSRELKVAEKNIRDELKRTEENVREGLGFNKIFPHPKQGYPHWTPQEVKLDPSSVMKAQLEATVTVPRKATDDLLTSLFSNHLWKEWTHTDLSYAAVKNTRLTVAGDNTLRYEARVTLGARPIAQSPWIQQSFDISGHIRCPQLKLEKGKLESNCEADQPHFSNVDSGLGQLIASIVNMLDTGLDDFLTNRLNEELPKAVQSALSSKEELKRFKSTDRLSLAFQIHGDQVEVKVSVAADNLNLHLKQEL